MEARCRISTSIKKGLTTFCQERSREDAALLRVLTDSNRLIFLPSPSDKRRLYPLTTLFEIGLERAFSGMPANPIVFQRKAARREL
jgi:hypothetical protein